MNRVVHPDFLCNLTQDELEAYERAVYSAIQAAREGGWQATRQELVFRWAGVLGELARRGEQLRLYP